MDIKEQLKDIKTQLRLSMNGAVSQSMREKGLPAFISQLLHFQRFISLSSLSLLIKSEGYRRLLGCFFSSPFCLFRHFNTGTSHRQVPFSPSACASRFAAEMGWLFGKVML